MFGLNDLYEKILGKNLPTDCGISCEFVDKATAKLSALLTESVSCFSYTLILSGTAQMNYNDKTVTVKKNDILIYTPGMLIQTISVSDDFSGISLMGEESTTYEVPYARNVISASYFPSAVYSGNLLTLTDKETRWLENRMKEIHTYIHHEHKYKKECLYSLYSLFILDLLNVENRMKEDSLINGHTIELFIRFMRLLANNFASHHDIAYYADKLAVTTIYLSRIVKRFSGQTVKQHIDRFLLMEAAYLLGNTDLPITAIADRLMFANPSSFSKFFSRNKGITPKEYRDSITPATK